MQQKYRMRLEKGFRTWQKFDKLTKLASKESVARATDKQ